MKEFLVIKKKIMNSLWTTIILAIILFGLALVSLGIGLLLTGKVRLKKKCGWEEKSGSCSICKKKECEGKKDDRDRRK